MRALQADGPITYYLPLYLEGETERRGEEAAQLRRAARAVPLAEMGSLGR